MRSELNRIRFSILRRWLTDDEKFLLIQAVEDRCGKLEKEAFIQRDRNDLIKNDIQDLKDLRKSLTTSLYC